MSRGPGIVQFIAVVTGAAVTAGIFACVGRIAGNWLPSWAVWTVLAVLLVFLGIGHLKFASARTLRSRDLAQVLEQIAEGSTAWRRTRTGKALVSRTGEGVRDAIELLVTRVNAVRQEQKRAELVLASMSDGMISVDCDGRITLFNRAASAFFGQKESQILGRMLEECELHPEITRIAYECLSTQSDVASEITLPGQTQTVLRVRATPYGAASVPDCAMIMLQDITDVRRHERYQKEFASNVSHELKTPVAAVRSTAETLLNGAKNDEQVVDQFLNSIISESDRLATLIDDIMEIAKLDSGVKHPEKAVSSVAETVRRAVSVLALVVEQKQLDMTLKVPEELTGYFDPNQLLRAVRNLADNAVKYTPEGGSVEVGARKDNSNILIWVKDTGIGIPHGEVGRVFTRFYRVDKARSRRLGGTGLGLPIVKDIVESHGGRVEVETEMGRGSTFTIVLPAAAKQTEDDE